MHVHTCCLSFLNWLDLSERYHIDCNKTYSLKNTLIELLPIHIQWGLIPVLTMASPLLLVCMLMVVLIEITCANMIYQRFRKPFDYNTALIDPAYNLETVKVRSMLSCSQRCSKNARCRSFNYKKQKDGGICQPNSRSFRELAYSSPPAEVAGFRYYESYHDGEYCIHLHIEIHTHIHTYITCIHIL